MNYSSDSDATTTLNRSLYIGTTKIPKVQTVRDNF